LNALGTFIERIRHDYGRVVAMVSIPGDRRDDDIREMGRIAARYFDHIIFREAPDGRGRPTGEVNAIMSQGALEAGVPSNRMQRIVDEAEAVEHCLSMGQPGDLILVLPTSVEKAWRQVVEFQPELVPHSSQGLAYG
jgi:cyanophycin synthetase